MIAHQSGWDEIGVFVVPLFFVLWLLRWAERRSRSVGVAAAGPGGESGGESRQRARIGERPRREPARLSASVLRLGGAATQVARTGIIALVLAFLVGLFLHIVHLGQHEQHEIGSIFHWLRDSALAFPIALLVVVAAGPVSRRLLPTAAIASRGRVWITWTGVTAILYALASIPGNFVHGKLFGAEHAHGSFLSHALRDAGSTLGAALVVLLLATFLFGIPWRGRSFVVVRAPAWGRDRLRMTWRRGLAAASAGALVVTVLPLIPTEPGLGGTGAQAQTAGCITADVVALDQPFYYNRLGAINPNGMMYALARDVVVQNTLDSPDVSAFDELTIPQALEEGALQSELSGQVTLRPDKRPRPLTLRMNEGDCLEITFTNLLDPVGFIFPLPGDFPGGLANEEIDDQPVTRVASIHIDGLELVGDMGSDGSNVGQNDTPDSLVAPGESRTYTYRAEHEAPHLMYSLGSTLGGEGNGGTRSYGLFGAVNVQAADAEWYRSQLTRQEMDWAMDLSYDVGEGECGNGVNPDPGRTCGGQPVLDYDAVYPAAAGNKEGLPIINMLADREIVHSDLNAIITGPNRGNFPQGTYAPNAAYGDLEGLPATADSVRNEPFREFTVILHDEAFGVQAFPSFYNDPVLGHTLHSVRDSFPINYGSGGIGSEIVANRLGVGPMWDCAECKYEEFFLTAFTVGDPAMIVDIPANSADGSGDVIPGPKATMALYPDDPSNVHHSYMNDRVKFRNLHAGPKEHHIFHLHAHQWLFNPDDQESNYLDGQAIGPGSAYTYEIAYGGSGNRNKTVGDSIFHCHFYPHFAQGMWELWRTHDTFENGTLLDIDGVPVAGSRALPDGEIVAGTPIPGLVPIPTNAMAPMPDPRATVAPFDLNGDLIDDSSQFDANGDGFADIFQPFHTFDTDNLLHTGVPVDTNGDGIGDIGVDMVNPGYPWFNPGLLGHRPPTPALDIEHDGGLPRHVITSGPDEDNLGHAGAPIEQYQTRLDFNKVLHEASAVQIPEQGTAVEQVAMAFHAGDGDPFYDTYFPNGTPTLGPSAGFEVNGLPPAPGAPYAEPCRTDPNRTTGAVELITQNRTIKGANIEMPVVLNKVGWHFQQQRFEALWEDVLPTLTHERAPQPMIMRLNSTDCAEYHHTNLVPNVYQLDDFQVRTPTDIIGQHIHLVKFDVMSADGSANGWNYEDGTLSPDEVRERMEAFNAGGGFLETNGTVRTDLEPEKHPFFAPGFDRAANGGDGAECDPEGFNSPLPLCGLNSQNWLGARTTIQRWYADPLLERSWDGGVGTVFTHDHYGPSTHQQVGLYSTLLIEPEDSLWKHNEDGTQLGTRGDGGPTSWQAIVMDCADGVADPDIIPADAGVVCSSSSADFDAHREFYFEFADFQHAYELGGGALGTASNEDVVNPVDIPSYADFDDAINPSFRQPPVDLADIFLHPDFCPGPLGAEPDRPCPEAISADDPGTYALNFRNEPIGLRLFNGELGAGAGQTPGTAGDLAFAYQSRTDRAIPELNVQPETNGISPYPPLTADLQPGDPWTPMLRLYMGDKARIRIQVGAHEEEHNFTIPGLKWRQEANSPNSGWRNSEFFGIDEYFNLDVPIVPDTASGTPARVDYIYTVGAEMEGIWNGVWGILRSYGKERSDLVELPNNDVGRNGYQITNEDDFNGICPGVAPQVAFNVTAVRAIDVLGPQGIVYNDRLTSLDGTALGGTSGVGPLIDPTALMYVLDDDLVFDPDTGAPIGLKPGVAVEPLMLRVNAGDCVSMNLTNALPADLSDTEMPGFNALPPIVHKTEGAGGITTFNANDIIPSSYVGLTPQLLAFDPRTDGGFSTGLTTGKLVAPGTSGTYKWYAGDVTVTTDPVIRNRSQFELHAAPVEFGAVGLMPADRIKGTESGLVGAMVVEPENSCWIVDPDTRAQATVWKDDNLSGACGTAPAPEDFDDSFRDFITIMQNDLNLRYGGGVCDPILALIDTMGCAVPSIAAEGAQGTPEDPQDSGQKAINYGADPLWFRLGITPNSKFDLIHKSTALKDLIPNVFANDLDGAAGPIPPLGDPQTPVYRASPTGPDNARFRVLMPGGHARGTTWTLHGHEWQRQPYVCGPTGTVCTTAGPGGAPGNGSSQIGDNKQSQYYGTQEGINPTGHWDFVVDLGGTNNVTGDYLFRDQASFGSYQGLWGLLRFDNTAPVAVNTAVEVPKYVPGELEGWEPGSVEIDLLGGAFDLDGLDGDAVSVAVTDTTDFGTLGDNDDGTFTYTYNSLLWPCDDFFSCPDTFTYTVTDDEGLVSNEGTVTVNVLNTAPVANHDQAEIDILTDPPDPNPDEGPPVLPQTIVIPVLANDQDAEGDLDPARIFVPDPAPKIEITTPPTAVGGGDAGVAVATDVITYTEAADTTDPPLKVVTFGYTVTDESGAESNEAFVRVAIRTDNVTITRAQYQPANQRWSISGTCSASGETMTIYFGASTMELPPVIGTAECGADNTWSFSGRSANPGVPTPSVQMENFVSIASSGEGVDWAFPVSFAGQNNAPVATPDAYSVDQGAVRVVPAAEGVLANDIDADFDPLTAVLVSDVNVGTLVLSAEGSFTYAAPATFDGTVTFTYKANDGQADSNVATATIAVGDVNFAPVAVDDAYSTAVATPLVVSGLAEGVLGNDTDLDGDALAAVLVSGPSDGELRCVAGDTPPTLCADGSFTYTPPASPFEGTVTFTYNANDGTVDSDLPATVTISVGVNDPPLAEDDVYAVEPSSTLVVAADGVLANDTDPNGDALAAVLVSGPSDGELRCVAGDTPPTLCDDGSFTYTPDAGFVGYDSFTYKANDGTVNSDDAATVTIAVDLVTVDKTRFRNRGGRWNLEGSMAIANETVTVFRCSTFLCPNAVEIGVATTSIDGSGWSFGGSGAVGASPGDYIFAVSTSGAQSVPVPVEVR